MSKFLSFLNSVVELPQQDIDLAVDGLANQLLSGLDQGLLGHDSTSREELKAALVDTARAHFLDNLGRTLSEDSRVTDRIERLDQPYALGLTTLRALNGYTSNLIVASAPQSRKYFDGMNQVEHEGFGHAADALAAFPGRNLRTQDELWVPNSERSQYVGARGFGEKHHEPAHTDWYARVRRSDGSTYELSALFEKAFVRSATFPLFQVQPFQARPVVFTAAKGEPRGSH